MGPKKPSIFFMHSILNYSSSDYLVTTVNYLGSVQRLKPTAYFPGLLPRFQSLVSSFFSKIEKEYGAIPGT